jgi:hypothetical protein
VYVTTYYLGTTEESHGKLTYTKKLWLDYLTLLSISTWLEKKNYYQPQLELGYRKFVHSSRGGDGLVWCVPDDSP